MKKGGIIIVLFFLFLHCNAQNDSAVYFKGAIKEKRATQYRNIVNNLINKNLSLPLSDSTEYNWEQAFDALEILQYKSPWVDGRIRMAFDSAIKRSVVFQQSLLELMYANYPKEFNIPMIVEDTIRDIHSIKFNPLNPKIFELCAEYKMQSNESVKIKASLYIELGAYHDTPLYSTDTVAQNMLNWELINWTNPPSDTISIIRQILSKDFLPAQTIVFSFQRSNRNYPGIAIVRDSSGHFIQDSSGIPFYIPQLARSITGLPFYFTGGNTPQGIFKMNGLDTSLLDAIGPTADIQLRMPFEDSIADFLSDSTIKDSVWTLDYYNKLLPAGCRNYFPLYETYYAGKIGRTEIIAHGTTVNPNYYIGKTYYPFTPTSGCLCANEIWSEDNGMRIESDEQKLVNAIKQTRKTVGYYVVIDIDDQQKPVSIQELLPFLNKLP
jgi:hypothetical protein